MTRPRIVVVGGGLAGLMATIRIVELGGEVDLFSLVPVRRSHSVCAQGGINAAVNLKGEGDSPEQHFIDTVKGGDFLAHQPLPKGMCQDAPAIIYMLDRMGVPFSRTPEGHLDFRRFGGTLYHRTAFAGATTGQQLIYALDEQVRRGESEGKVRKFEFWEFLGMVKDGSGVCRGIVAMDLRTMQVHSFAGVAVMLATGGPGLVFGRSTNSMANTGSAVTSAWNDGAVFANPEFIQVHPTAIPGDDKLRLMSESARGEGGRVWVPRAAGDARPPKQIPEAERYYFLEEKYPRFGNLVPRDIGTREIYDVCVNQGLGVAGQMSVYLDLTHIPRAELDRKLGGILEIYEIFVGDDPRDVPMRIFPAVHYSMGGLWVSYEAAPDGTPDLTSSKNHSTNIPGLYAIGECEFQYHGANRLGANALLSCIYAGKLGGLAAMRWAKDRPSEGDGASSSLFDAEARRWTERFAGLARMDGPENPYRLHQELGDVMTRDVTIVRDNAKLKAADQKILELGERWSRVGLSDAAGVFNYPLAFINQLRNMIDLGRIIVLGALARDESRGAHYKPAFPARDDANWLKTTLVRRTDRGPVLDYEPIDISLARPVERHYD